MALPGAEALGPTAALTVLATLALTALSYALAELAAGYGGRTAHNFFASLLTLDGILAMAIFAGAIDAPAGYVVYLLVAQVLLVVAPYALGAVFLSLAPGAAVVGAIPIAIALGLLTAMDFGLVQLHSAARLGAAFIVVVLGPTVISAASWQLRNVLD